MNPSLPTARRSSYHYTITAQSSVAKPASSNAQISIIKKWFVFLFFVFLFTSLVQTNRVLNPHLFNGGFEVNFNLLIWPQPSINRKTTECDAQKESTIVLHKLFVYLLFFFTTAMAVNKQKT